MNFLQNLVPLRDTNYAQRKRRVFEALMESKKNMMIETEIEKAEKEEEEIKKQMEMASRFGESAKKRECRKKLAEELEENYNIMKDLLVEAMVDIFYESILLDDDFKTKFYSNITEQAELFFNEAFNQGLLTLESFSKCKSQIVRDLYVICEEQLTLMKDEELDEEELEVVMDEAECCKKPIVETIADVVKDKVAKVVKTEKDIAEKNKEELEELKAQEHVFQRYERPSLFRSIMINNSRVPFNEDGEATDNLDMDMVMAESLIQYTLLEVMNTTRLLNLSPSQVQSLAFKFSFKE